MIDAVCVYHTNPLACGVTKFSEQLARRLGVPCVPLARANEYRHPLASVKAAEIGADWLSLVPAHGDLLLHDRPAVVPSGRRIYYADTLGCPPTIEGDASRGRYRVLTFGMGNKMSRVLPHYEALKRHLDADVGDYSVELSCAIHEGNPWSEALEQSISDLRAIFGDKLRVLGFLGDDALAKELAEVDAVAVFFDPAFRANNTSAWAAVAAGKTLITNRDEHSPSEMPTWDGLLTYLGQPSAAETMTR